MLLRDLWPREAVAVVLPLGDVEQGEKPPFFLGATRNKKSYQEEKFGAAVLPQAGRSHRLLPARGLGRRAWLHRQKFLYINVF